MKLGSCELILWQGKRVKLGSYELISGQVNGDTGSCELILCQVNADTGSCELISCQVKC